MNFSCIAVAFTSLYIVRHNPNPQSLSNKLSKINSRKLYIYKILPPPLLLSHHRPYIRQKFRKNFHQKISRPSNIWCSLSKTRRKERERERDNRTPKDWFEKFSLSLSQKRSIESHRNERDLDVARAREKGDCPAP